MCLTLCDPMDCSPSGSSVHRISQARILERVAISFSRGLSLSRDQTWVSYIAGRFFTIRATGKTYIIEEYVPSLNLGPHGKLKFSCLDQVLYTFRGQWGIWAPLHFFLIHGWNFGSNIWGICPKEWKHVPLSALKCKWWMQVQEPVCKHVCQAVANPQCEEASLSAQHRRQSSDYGCASERK